PTFKAASPGVLPAGALPPGGRRISPTAPKIRCLPSIVPQTIEESNPTSYRVLCLRANRCRDRGLEPPTSRFQQGLEKVSRLTASILASKGRSTAGPSGNPHTGSLFP